MFRKRKQSREKQRRVKVEAKLQLRSGKWATLFRREKTEKQLNGRVHLTDSRLRRRTHLFKY